MMEVSGRRWVALCCLCLLCAPGCAQPRPEDTSNEILIGALLPFTGDRSATGANYERALILATERVNRAGGIAGRPIRLVSKDTHSNVQRGLQSAQALLDLGISGLIGPDEPEITAKMAPLLGDDPVTQILPTIASPPRSAGRAPDANWFHIAPNSDSLGCTMGTRIYGDAFSHVVVVNQDDLFFSAMANSVLARYNVLLNPVVDAHRADAVATTFTAGSGYASLVRSTMAKAPDTLVLLAYPETAAEVVAAFSASGENPHWYLAPMLQTGAFLENCPSGVMDGSLGIGAALPDDQQSFASQFEARWSGEPPAIESYFYYDALILWALALEAAYYQAGGPPSNAQIQEQVTLVSRAGSNPVAWDAVGLGLGLASTGQQINYRGASGKLDLDQNGELSADSRARFWAVHQDQIIEDTYGVCMPLSSTP
jgi:branched-chain amino acid transport system substrate-binding protein